MSTEAQLKSMQDQIAALVKGMEELRTENEKLKLASTSSSSSVGLSLVSSKSVSVSDADLTRLKILSALELKVGESLKLKSDSPSDVLSYKRAVENYLKANSVLFVLAEAERDARNVYLFVENEVTARVYQFLLDSWPESLRVRYVSQAESDPKKLWTLLMKDSFKIEVSKITAAKENFKNVKYRMGMKPEDLISKLEKSFEEYEHLIALYNEEKTAEERISFPDMERVAALYRALDDVANESPVFIALRLALKEVESWNKAKNSLVSVCDTVNETYNRKNDNSVNGFMHAAKRKWNQPNEKPCYNCGQPGHLRMHCPKEKSHCNYCEKDGHLEEYCFIKRFIEKKNGYQKKGGETTPAPIEHKKTELTIPVEKDMKNARITTFKTPNFWK